jgi:hypothetical protein
MPSELRSGKRMKLSGLNRMWSRGLAVFAVMIICCIFLFPSVAMAAEPNTGPQTWSLDSNHDNNGIQLPGSVYQMKKNAGLGSYKPSGSVNIPSGGSSVWISNRAAETDIVIPVGDWLLQMVTDSDWGTNGDKCQIEIGEWDGSHFILLTPKPLDLKAIYRNSFLIVKLYHTYDLFINKGNYLALRVTNLEVSKTKKYHTVCTGTGTQNSFLRSTQTFSIVVLPEPAAGVLLAIGLVGLGSFFVMRRKSLKKA